MKINIKERSRTFKPEQPSSGKHVKILLEQSIDQPEKH